MYSVTIHINLNEDNALSDLKEIKDGPFTVYKFEIINENDIKFVMDVNRCQDAVAEALRKKDAIRSLEWVSDTQLLVTKRSSGILPIIRKNHGIFQTINQFYGTHRTFDIVVFDRADLKEIVESLRKLGTVRLDRLRPFTGPSSLLSSRQSEVLELAYEEGYFDWPRNTDAETLADQLDISHATFLEHLRKAEKKIIDQVVGGAAPNPETMSHHTQRSN